MYEFLSYRSVKIEDARLLLDWRISPHVATKMLTEIGDDIEEQVEWITSSANKKDYFHRIIQIEGIDVGLTSITLLGNELSIGEVGAYIGDLNVPRALSIYNFLGTLNHAFDNLKLSKVVNRIIESNHRTRKLQKFNGFREANGLQDYKMIDGKLQKIHCYEQNSEEWLVFRNRFKYYKDWDGNTSYRV